MVYPSPSPSLLLKTVHNTITLLRRTWCVLGWSFHGSLGGLLALDFDARNALSWTWFHWFFVSSTEYSSCLPLPACLEACHK